MKRPGSKKKVRRGKKLHGFRARMKTASGRKIIKNRRRKGRTSLAKSWPSEKK